MKKRLVEISIVLSAIFLLNSCATIFYSTKQKVTLNSSPSGADIYVNGIATNKQTPYTISIKRKAKATEYNKKNQYTYLFMKKGYEDYLVSDKAKFRSGFLLLDIFGNLYPVIVDIATGALWKYKKQSNVNLSVSNNNISTSQTEKSFREHYLALIAIDNANKQREEQLKRQQRAENWNSIAQEVTQGLQQYEAQSQFINNPNGNTGITDAYYQSAARIDEMARNSQAKNNVNNSTNSNQYTVPVINLQQQQISNSFSGGSGNSNYSSIAVKSNTNTSITNSSQSNNNIVGGSSSNINSESLAGSTNTAGNNTFNSDATAACAKQAMGIYHNDERYKQYLKNPDCSKFGYISQKALAEISLNNCRQYLPQGDIDGLIKTIDWLNTTINGMPNCETICWISPDDPFFSEINSKRDNALKKNSDQFNQSTSGLDAQYFYPFGNRADGKVVCRAHKTLDCPICNQTVNQLRKTALSNNEIAIKNINNDYDKAFKIKKDEYCKINKN